MPFWVVWWNLALSCSSHLGRESSLCLMSKCCICYLPVIHLAAVLAKRWTIAVSRCPHLSNPHILANAMSQMPSCFVSLCTNHISYMTRRGSTVQEDILRDHIHITFITVYHYSCPILLLVIVLNFIVYKLVSSTLLWEYVYRTKYSIYRAWYSMWLQ